MKVGNILQSNTENHIGSLLLKIGEKKVVKICQFEFLTEPKLANLSFFLFSAKISAKFSLSMKVCLGQGGVNVEMEPCFCF